MSQGNTCRVLRKLMHEMVPGSQVIWYASPHACMHTSPSTGHMSCITLCCQPHSEHCDCPNGASRHTASCCGTQFHPTSHQETMQHAKQTTLSQGEFIQWSSFTKRYHMLVVCTTMTTSLHKHSVCAALLHRICKTARAAAAGTMLHLAAAAQYIRMAAPSLDTPSIAALGSF